MITDVGILGFGHALPDTVRHNDDPLFAALPPAGPFTGFRERRVLAAGERVEDLGLRAARAALADAGVAAGAIDRLYGAVSPSEHLLPSGLFALHAELGLRRDATVVPIHSDFTNFVVALTSACEAVAAGRCERALVVVAAGWSRLVDYADAGAFGIGDGAGAVVVGRGGSLRFVDELGETHGELHEAMTVQVRRPKHAEPGTDPRPTFVFEAAARRVYAELSTAAPSRLWTALLARHGLSPAEVALVTHQPNRPVLEAWQRALSPAELPSVVEALGNCTLATSAIVLSLHARALQSRHVVLMGFGCGQNFAALLLRRA
ncbi:3-oxoacyl-[acyl-carrier-protein] synthase-3 [Nannocystis exedens]|uniref:3-oxoacyl-[acyl-carrier-protein] synthase-3 n=1 Tax=Nannocystis exedens TaxID=54 RepID=A0A1I2BWT8_9BACT|nr:3-oxoacyl-[acyl-carrier-protein] synthase III C-terminal domain-containing protein [Nannocystis exedens]PCC71241.1 3-oxoacyl-ACP synthase III [Nannocystis exedens]SFE59893.1 3-oxoacyl-[acyl-carrier-protein] synthase-3 [Nannocystis exedens]